MLHVLTSILEVEGDVETSDLLRSQAKSLAEVLLEVATDLDRTSSSAVSFVCPVYALALNNRF